MVAYWTNFAHSGTPNGPTKTAVAWPRYEAAADVYLALRTPSPQVLENFGAEHHCDFWDGVVR